MGWRRPLVPCLDLTSCLPVYEKCCLPVFIGRASCVSCLFPYFSRSLSHYPRPLSLSELSSGLSLPDITETCFMLRFSLDVTHNLDNQSMHSRLRRHQLPVLWYIHTCASSLPHRPIHAIHVHVWYAAFLTVVLQCILHYLGRFQRLGYTYLPSQLSHW